MNLLEFVLLFDAIIDFIQFSIYRAMKNIENSMSGVLFNQLLICILFIALLLFSIDEMGQRDDSTVPLNWTCLIAYLAICFVYCRFSEDIKQKSFGIGDAAYNSLFWYEIPIMEQNAIFLIIKQSRKSFRLTGLGMVDCSLATFLTVSNKFHSIRSN